jgi:hypothetical protein
MNEIGSELKTQGLKPASLFLGLIGTTEVAPFPFSLQYISRLFTRYFSLLNFPFRCNRPAPARLALVLRG